MRKIRTRYIDRCYGAVWLPHETAGHSPKAHDLARWVDVLKPHFVAVVSEYGESAISIAQKG